MVEAFKHGRFKRDIVQALQNKPWRLIYLAAGPTEAPKIIKKLRQNGIRAVIMGGDSYVAQDIIRMLGSQANNIYFTSHAWLAKKSQNPQLRQFVHAYAKKFNHYPANAFAALGYDTVNLIAAVLRKANGFSAQDFINEINRVHNFVGVTGKMSYSNGRHLPVKSVNIIAIQNGHAFLAKRMIPKNE